MNNQASVSVADDPREALRRQLNHVRSDTLAQAEMRLALYRSRYPGGIFTASARNLAHYLALRRFDLRSLQDSLSETGISSLGRCEAHVLQTLDQVISLLGGEPADTLPEIRGLQAGRDLLAEHTRRIFGADPPNRYTRIMVTLPSESAEDYPLIRNLLAGGMNCARINCAHDDPDIWEKLARNVRRAQVETGLDCRVLMDLAGTKLRTVPVAQIPEVLHLRTRRDRYGRTLAPASVSLCTEQSARAPAEAAGHCRVHLSPALYGALREGDRLSFRDTRGKQRHINVLQRDEPGPWQGECWGNAYLCGETVLHLERIDDGVDFRRIGSHRFTRYPTEDIVIRLRVDDRLLLSTAPEPGLPATPGTEAPRPAAIGCSYPTS